MFIARAFGDFRFANCMSYSVYVVSCVGECCTCEIANSGRFVPFFVMGDGDGSTIRLFRRVGTFILMGYRGSFTIAAYPRFVTSNVPNACFAIVVSFTIGNGGLFAIKEMGKLSSALQVCGKGTFIYGSHATSNMGAAPVQAAVASFLYRTWHFIPRLF